MESVNYDEIVRWLGNSRKTIPTLGKRKTLTFWVENGIITSEDTHGNINTYSREYWQEICRVINETAPERVHNKLLSLSLLLQISRNTSFV